MAAMARRACIAGTRGTVGAGTCCTAAETTGYTIASRTAAGNTASNISLRGTGPGAVVSTTCAACHAMPAGCVTALAHAAGTATAHATGMACTRCRIICATDCNAARVRVVVARLARAGATLGRKCGMLKALRRKRGIDIEWCMLLAGRLAAAERA